MSLPPFGILSKSKGTDITALLCEHVAYYNYSKEMHVIEMDQERCKCRGTETFFDGYADAKIWMNFENCTKLVLQKNPTTHSFSFVG